MKVMMTIVFVAAVLLIGKMKFDPEDWRTR